MTRSYAGRLKMPWPIAGMDEHQRVSHARQVRRAVAGLRVWHSNFLLGRRGWHRRAAARFEIGRRIASGGAHCRAL